MSDREFRFACKLCLFSLATFGVAQLLGVVNAVLGILVTLGYFP